MTDFTCDSNCLASHHSNASRPAMPASSNGRIRRQRVCTSAARDEDDVAADEERDQHPLRHAVLLFEAVDRLLTHPEEPGEPTQGMIAIGAADEVADSCRQAVRRTVAITTYANRRDSCADGSDQVAVARRQHDQPFGARLHPVGEDDVGDVGAHDQGDEGDEQERPVGRSMARLDDLVGRGGVHATAL